MSSFSVTPCACGWPRAVFNIFYIFTLMEQRRGFWNTKNLVKVLINLSTDRSISAAVIMGPESSSLLLKVRNKKTC